MELSPLSLNKGGLFLNKGRLYKAKTENGDTRDTCDTGF